MAKLLMLYMSADGLMEFHWIRKRDKLEDGFVRFRNQEFFLDPRKMFRARWPEYLMWPFIKLHKGIMVIRFDEGRPGAVPVGAHFVQAVLPGDEIPTDAGPRQATSYAIDMHTRNTRARTIFQPEKKLDPVVLFLGLCLLVAVAGDVILGLTKFMR